MGDFQLFTLAIIQGITEFLPISSSGHLAMISPLLGWQDQGLIFDISVHIGTLTAVVIYCWKDLWDMLWGVIQASINRELNDGVKMVLLLILATLPVVIVGFSVRDWVEFATRNLAVIGWMTLVFGILLGVADRLGRTVYTLNDLNWKSAFWIGASQIISLVPGTSRSGITMTTARMLGFNRVSSAKFSFLLSIPTILGAGVLSMADYFASLNAQVPVDGLHSGLDLTTLIMGGGISCITALLAMKVLIAWLERAGMMIFVGYRIILGILLILWDAGLLSY